MSSRWNRAKAQTQSIVAGNGQWLQWLARSTSGSSMYDTGSSATFGYGDPVVYYTTGSFRGIVAPTRERDILIEPGFYAQDYNDVFVDPDNDPSFWDQILIPSGSGTRYIIYHVEEWTPYGIDVSKILKVRLLNPRSGSTY